jgi:beta-N-acetylhexosaminidase
VTSLFNRRQFLTTLAAGLIGLRFKTTFAQDEPSARVEAFLTQMSIRQKVGQLFLFSMNGTAFNAAMNDLIATYHAGGMTLFGYNVESPEQLTQLSNDMQRAAVGSGLPVPLFIAADQEGGRVLRLNGNGFSPFPSPMTLGAAHDFDLTYRFGEAIAQEMSACGLNMNLAPVLDVNARADNPVINVRSFGGDPAMVAQHGAAFIRGTQSAHVIATGKHFPGHGDTVVDSHISIPVVESNRESLMQHDIAPFVESFAADLQMLMTAHVVYQGLDNTPATFSAPIMTDLLRNDLGYQGLLMSDALTMGAVSEARDRPIYALRDAINAGVDMLTYGALPNGTAPSLASQIEALETVVALVESGLIDEARITESARRILSIKNHFGLLDWRAIETSDTRERMNLLDHDALLTEVAQQAVTLLSDGGGLLPLNDADPVAVVFPEEVPETGQILTLGLRDAVAVPYSMSSSAPNLVGLLDAIGERTVICVSVDTYRNPGGALVVNALPLERTIVIAARSPYDILNFANVQTYLTIYSPTPHALTAVREVILGQREASGVLPVTLFDSAG